jgi:hypothetical protein
MWVSRDEFAIYLQSYSRLLKAEKLTGHVLCRVEAIDENKGVWNVFAFDPKRKAMRYRFLL